MPTPLSPRLQVDLFAADNILFSPNRVRSEIENAHLPAVDAGGLERLKRWQGILQDHDERDRLQEAQDKANFIGDLFERVLGYATRGARDIYHLRHETAGKLSARPADHLLGFFGKDRRRVRAVIEVKSPGIDLDAQSHRRDRLSAVDQAFQYAKDHDGVQWVIVTNFDEIRLYHRIRGATAYERWFTRDLKGEELRRFVFLLRRENLIAEDGESRPLTLALAEETWRAQERITKLFYEEYQTARADLFAELRRQNPDVEAEEILEATQLLLDRLLFIMFCADRRLLPEDVIERVREQGDPKNFARKPDTVWNALLSLFAAVNEGNDLAGITGYNGGLFRPALVDELHFENEKMSSSFVLNRILKWDEYNFESQIDVEILGHIFENSISDLEALRREIKQDPNVVGLSWRNREGIFYTPSWVTSYIVRHTAGRYLEEHPGIGPDFKVVDPACGSGAFLIQLIPLFRRRIEQLAPEEVAAIEETIAKDSDAFDLFFDPSAMEPRALYSAMQRSLYGVDRSHESVEITKLSFWLKTVVRGRALPRLDENIEAGNSLCPDGAAVLEPMVWPERFPFLKDRGFDVVVGNPPWVSTPPDYAECLERFELAEGQYDLAFLFMEQALDLLRPGGYLGFIVPDSILVGEETEPVRRMLLEENTLREVIRLGEGVFPGVYRGSSIIIVEKGPPPEGHTFDSLIVIKDDRKQITDVASDVNLDVLMAERGTTIRVNRVLENPRAELDIFVGEEDIPLLAKIEANVLDWSAVVSHGRGIELNRAGHVVRCPYCHKWGPPPAKKKGVWQPKICNHCGDEFRLENALSEAHIILDALDSPDGDEQWFIDGSDFQRYRILDHRKIDVSKDGIDYKHPEQYRSPKILFREAGIGITATMDYALDAYVPKSVYVANLREDREGDAARYRLEYILGVINSRVMLYHYFKRTGRVEWQSFPRWTQRRMSELPIRAIDWSDRAEVKLHDDIADAVETLIKEKHDGSPDADLHIERAIMELYGLAPDEQTRVWETLRSVQELQTIREVVPPRQLTIEDAA